MSNIIARRIVLAIATLALAACGSVTAPQRACGGGVVAGTGQC